MHLDVLRFVASIGIVYHHSHEFFVPFDEREQLIAKTAGLADFVDLFFIVSGFVITYVYCQRIYTIRDYGLFLQRRIARLVPLHWVTLLVAIATWAVFVLAHSAGNHAPSFNPLCIADTAFLTHSFIPCGNRIYFNGQSWSISTEMIMYLIFPVISVIGRYSYIISLIIVFLLILLASFMSFQSNGFSFNIRWDDINPVLRGLPSFIFGSVLYYGREHLRWVPNPSYIMVGALFLLVTSMLVGASQFLTLLLVYATVILAVAADLKGKNSGWVRAIAPLGQLTYSMYMWHGLIILVLMNAIADKYLHTSPPLTMAATALCYVAIAIVSYLSFFFLETPARRYIDKMKIL